MNRILADYLLEVRTRLSALPYKEQDEVMAEVKAHLLSDIEERRARSPKKSEDELALAATAAFGDPDEIGVAYGPKGGLVNKGTGQVLLRAAVLTGRGAKATAKAAGRGLGRTLKWAGIIVGALVLVGAVLAVVLLVAYKDTV